MDIATDLRDWPDAQTKVVADGGLTPRSIDDCGTAAMLGVELRCD